MIRVLVAEDSPTARALLVQILSADAGLTVVGEAKTGKDAVEKVRELRPDVVTMDIQMPEMNGYEATQQIMLERPTPIVIVSGLDVRDVNVSLNALKAGALAVLPKPPGPLDPTFAEVSRDLAFTVRTMSQVKLMRRSARAQSSGTAVATVHNERNRTSSPALAPVSKKRGVQKLEVLAITASTGGPAALHKILSELPGDFPVPVLVQHIALGFSSGLATWLDGAGALRVKVATQGENLVAGNVYLAPDNRHLGVGALSTALLSDEPPISGFRPSGTFLFESVARAYGAGAGALILTGMGRDGVDGLKAINAVDGRVAAQDEETSAVFGMPQEAIKAGLVDTVVPLPELAAMVRRWLKD